MKRTNIVELRNHLSEASNSARYGRERIEVRRRGRILAAIVPPARLHAIQNGLQWRPNAGAPEAGWLSAAPPRMDLPEAPDPCDTVL